MTGFFITATDTGVGKTIFTAALAAKIRQAGRDVVGLKPFASGAAEASALGDKLPAAVQSKYVATDALFIERAAKSGEPLSAINPVLLKQPLAPAVAARLEGVHIDVPAIAAHCKTVAKRHELAIVEGVGGLLVALNDDVLVADFAKMLDLPMLIVARPNLGTLNHTLLTAECARRRGLRPAGIVISGFPATPDIAERTNSAELERLTHLPILATLPHVGGLDTERLKSGDWQRILDAVDPQRFLSLLEEVTS